MLITKNKKKKNEIIEECLIDIVKVEPTPIDSNTNTNINETNIITQPKQTFAESRWQRRTGRTIK